jgi:hypothetical protein
MDPTKMREAAEAAMDLDLKVSVAMTRVAIASHRAAGEHQVSIGVDIAEAYCNALDQLAAATARAEAAEAECARLRTEVREVYATIDAEHAKLSNITGVNYESGVEYGLRWALIRLTPVRAICAQPPSPPCHRRPKMGSDGRVRSLHLAAAIMALGPMVIDGSRQVTSQMPEPPKPELVKESRQMRRAKVKAARKANQRRQRHDQ